MDLSHTINSFLSCTEPRAAGPASQPASSFVCNGTFLSPPAQSEFGEASWPRPSTDICHLSDLQNWARHSKLGSQSLRNSLEMETRACYSVQGFAARQAEGVACAPRPAQDREWPLDTSSRQPGSVRPAWRWQAGRRRPQHSVLAVCSLPRFKPQPKTLQTRLSSLPSHCQESGRNRGGWPKPVEVTGGAVEVTGGAVSLQVPGGGLLEISEMPGWKAVTL